MLLFELTLFEPNNPESDTPRSIVLEWNKRARALTPNSICAVEFNSPRTPCRGRLSDVLLDRVVPEALGGVARRYFADTTYVYELTAPLSIVIDQAEIDRTTRLSRPA